MKIKILVATHKQYQMPEDKNLYLPIFVGKDLKPGENIPGYLADNIGDNISSKNTTYSELTALYWAWKNLDADVIGLVHYRRYLSLSRDKNLQTVLNETDIKNLLKDTDIILPKKRKYYIQSNYKHYINAHHRKPLEETRNIIAEVYPGYLPAYDKFMKKRSAHMFNMFIMKRDKFDAYCQWMFDILRRLEDRIDISEYSSYEKRVYGFVSEILLDVWIEKNEYSYKEVNFVHLESQHWMKKGTDFILRTFGQRLK